ncbi:hypothetical protein HC251_22925 [Iamia sp. SCSIO 61187]|nr:hypothetical protein HC251_22925 [Iamia sp. SCSIO 61187]
MRLREPIERGEVDLLFRRWKRLQAVVGHTYRTAAGRLRVTAIDVVDPADLTADDARRSGHADVAALRASLRGDEALPTYRIAVEVDTDPDPRSLLAADDALDDDAVAELDRRLARLDAASSWGPWTMATLRLIAARPATVSTVLAETLGRERQPFKLDVRKLKALGLTESLEVGYRLSRRGEAYLARTTRPG